MTSVVNTTLHEVTTKANYHPLKEISIILLDISNYESTCEGWEGKDEGS